MFHFFILVLIALIKKDGDTAFYASDRLLGWAIEKSIDFHEANDAGADRFDTWGPIWHLPSILGWMRFRISTRFHFRVVCPVVDRLASRSELLYTAQNQDLGFSEV